MLTKWMKRGLVSGLVIGSVVLVAGCAQQQAPAPEAPAPEAPAATDTTMAAPAAADTSMAPAAADTTKAAEPMKEEKKK